MRDPARRPFAALRRALLATLLALPFAPAAWAGGKVTVFAAASLKTALDAFAARWQAATGTEVVISYAGSNALAQQILAGAPADVFLSASEAWMDTVEKAGLIAVSGRRDLLGNNLVLVAHGAQPSVAIGPDLDLAGLLGDGHLAMAAVDAVPAGQYGKAALVNLGLWESVAPRVAQAQNVRAALALVATGEAPLGIVYATDAVAEPQVSVIGTFPEDSHPAITYPAALLTSAADPEAARAFYEALSGAEARAAFEAQGFTVKE